MTFPLLFACFMGIFFAFSRSPLMSLFRIIDSISRGKLRWVAPNISQLLKHWFTWTTYGKPHSSIQKHTDIFFFFKDNIHPHTHTPMVVSGETCLSSTCRLEEPGPPTFRHSCPREIFYHYFNCCNMIISPKMGQIKNVLFILLPTWLKDDYTQNENIHMIYSNGGS